MEEKKRKNQEKPGKLQNVTNLLKALTTNNSQTIRFRSEHVIAPKIITEVEKAIKRLSSAGAEKVSQEVNRMLEKAKPHIQRRWERH